MRAIALTITTGLCGSRSRTIAAARSIAAASSTEVPPNFMTIMPELQAASSGQVSVRVKQLGVQQGSARGTSHHVVREHGELPVEQVAGPKAADRDGHAGAGIHVEARLRAVSV